MKWKGQGVVVVAVIVLIGAGIKMFIARNETLDRERLAQEAYDNGRISLARYQNASIEWRRGWDWQVTHSPFGGEIACDEKLAGKASMTEDEYVAFESSDLLRGCMSAQMEHYVTRNLNSGDRIAYELGASGLSR